MPAGGLAIPFGYRTRPYLGHRTGATGGPAPDHTTVSSSILICRESRLRRAGVGGGLVKPFGQRACRPTVCVLRAGSNAAAAMTVTTGRPTAAGASAWSSAQAATAGLRAVSSSRRATPDEGRAMLGQRR